MSLSELSKSLLLLHAEKTKKLKDLDVMISLSIDMINQVELNIRFREHHKKAFVRLQQKIALEITPHRYMTINELTAVQTSTTEGYVKAANILVENYKRTSDSMGIEEKLQEFNEIWGIAENSNNLPDEEEEDEDEENEENEIDATARASAELAIYETAVELRESGGKPDLESFGKKLAKIFGRPGGGIGRFRILPCPQWIAPGQEYPRPSVDSVVTGTVSFATTRPSEGSVRDANQSLDGFDG